MNARQKVAAVAAAATLVALAGLGTLGSQVTNRATPFKGCEQRLAEFPSDVLGAHVKHLPDGLVEYLLEDCTTVTSHGPDTMPGDVAGLSSQSSSTLQAAGAPQCATDYQFVAVYIQPSNGANNYTADVPQIQNTIKQVDGKLTSEAANRKGSGAQAHYKFKCNTDGTIYVAKVVSAYSTSTVTFDNLVSDLKAKGYNSSTQKYISLWDGASPNNFSGQATLNSDSSDSSGNSNNNGPSYAFAYGNFDWLTWMHEMGHNQGAVNTDAPGSTSGHHCDGTSSYDVMCYNDGSANWTSTPVCNPAVVSGQNSYDVCHNQYWAPEHLTADGSYEGNHWNQAKCYTRWQVSTWCGWVPPNPTPTPAPSPTATSTTSAPAVYNTTYKTPACLTVQPVCDSGTSLLNGRDNMSGGIEPNQPNTLYSSCPDDTYGTYHSDESIDQVKVATSDGTPMAAGKTVTFTVKGWAYNATQDALDLYYTGNAGANPPTWTLIKTMAPTAAGAQTWTATYMLPAGTNQAVRASLRYLGSAAPCNGSTYGYTDPDDLVFAVGTGTPTPTPTPTATTTTTPTPTPTPTATSTPGAPACSDGIDNDNDGQVDGADGGCFQDPNGTGNYVYDPNATSEDVHYGLYYKIGQFGNCTGGAVGNHSHSDPTLCAHGPGT